MSANDYAHRQLTRVVSGAVDDAFKNHPDYLTQKGKRSAKGSIVKRVTGTVLSFAVQAAKGRSAAVQESPGHHPAAPVSVVLPTVTGDGDLLSSSPLNPHCRIGKVRSKLRSRYRGAQAFDLTVSRLVRLTAEVKGEARAAARTRASIGEGRGRNG